MKPSKPTVLLIGGLGNQLFQYAYGLYLEYEHKISVDYSDFFLNGKSNRGTTPRDFSLEDLIESNDIKKITVISIIRARLLSIFTPRRFVREDVSGSDTGYFVTEKSEYILGYFQNWKIIAAVWKNLRPQLMQSERFRGIISSGQGTTHNYLALHIRLGDYRTLNSASLHHGVTDISYYLEAVELLSSMIKVDEIHVVSDEPELAYLRFLEHYNGKLRVVNATRNDEILDLTTLAQAKGVVMSNSSFSWWGAWIAANEQDAQIVMPTPWFAEAPANKVSLEVPGWHVLSRRIDSQWLREGNKQ